MNPTVAPRESGVTSGDDQNAAVAAMSIRALMAPPWMRPTPRSGRQGSRTTTLSLSCETSSAPSKAAKFSVAMALTRFGTFMVVFCPLTSASEVSPASLRPHCSLRNCHYS